MDALLYYDHYDPIPAPWYQCCGCARTELPVGGCQCVCHEENRDFEDWEEEDEMALTVNGRRTGRAAATERQELMQEIEDAYWERVRRVKQAKADFGKALEELEAVDPDWEAWYDDDNNIPPLIYWANRAQIDELIRRIRERMQMVALQRGCACFEKVGDNNLCPVHTPIVSHAEASE